MHHTQQTQRSFWNTAKAYLFLLPSLLGVMVFTMVPFLDVIRRSFMDAMGRQFTGFANYRLVLGNEAFRQAAGNTGRFLLLCIPLLLLLSLGAALLLRAPGAGSQVFKTIFLLPMAIPVAGVVLLWKLVFDRSGYLNQITAAFGLSGVDWMNGKTAFAVLVFSYLWKNTGYDMVLWLAGLNAIPVSLYEAARVDGANVRNCFLYITLPNLKSSVFMIGVLSFINSFKVFREAYLVAGDYPNESIYMLQHLFNNWFVRLDIHKMSAAAVMTSGFIGVLLIPVVAANDRAEDML